MPQRRPGPPADEGFTLVEVVVSLALLTVAATAALYFFIGGTRAVSHQQQSQNAVVVANEAMEFAYGAAATLQDKGGLTVSGLVLGRSQADVEAQWSALATEGVEGYAQTYAGWDASIAEGEEPAVPLVHESTLSNVDYTAQILIGSCYRSLTAQDAACGTVGATQPSSTPVGYAQLMRVMVRVSWQSQSCEADGCSYQVASLIDPNTDLVWNNTTRPIAVDDDAVVDVGGTVLVDVLHNDILGVIVANPVRIETSPSQGSVALQSDGQVLYTAPTDASGIVTFTYSLKDQSGRESNDATVRVRVMPKAVDDTASTSRGVAVTIPVTDNDLGSPASVTLVDPPATGTATVSGTSVVFDPQGVVGTVTFTYFFTDGSELESTQATVTVTVSEWAPPLSADLTVEVPATTVGSEVDLGMLGLTGNPDGYLVEVLSATIGQGQLHVDGRDYNNQTNTTGSTVSYSQQGNVLGVWTFQYRVWTPDKSVGSEVRTVTLVILPVPQDDNFTVSRGARNVALDIKANDAPNNYAGTVQLTPTLASTPTCGAMSASQGDAQNGILRFDAPNQRGTCTFTYVLQGTGQYSSLVSEPATVTVTVR